MAEPDFLIRTRAAYDTVAEPYAERFAAELAARPLDRAVLGGFAELVTAADGALGGLVAWYSIIRVPDERLPDVFAEFHRVLAPGGYAQLAFAVGDEVVHRDELGGHPVSLDFHPRRPERVADLLCAAGLHPRARLVREPDTDGDYPEQAPQAFLLARKPLGTGRMRPE